MDYQNTLQINIKWLKKKLKHLSDDEIEIKARKMTDKYISDNIEKIEKEEAEEKKMFDEPVARELLYFDLFGDD